MAETLAGQQGSEQDADQAHGRHQDQGRPQPERVGTPSRAKCGADRDRTGNLLVANQALSQLSYDPKLKHALV